VWLLAKPLDTIVPHPDGLPPVLDDAGRHVTQADGKPRYHVSSVSGGMPVEALQEVRATAEMPFEAFRRRVVRFIQSARRTVAYVARPDDGQELHQHHNVVMRTASPLIAFGVFAAFARSRLELRRQRRR
jgi:hypothetical protein